MGNNYEDFTERILQALRNAYDLQDESEEDELEDDDELHYREYIAVIVMIKKFLWWFNTVFLI